MARISGTAPTLDELKRDVEARLADWSRASKRSSTGSIVARKPSSGRS
jgi:hypothetical protein